MSIILSGNLGNLSTIISGIIYYESLCLSQCNSLSTSDCGVQNETTVDFILKTKYYNANLKIKAVEHNAEDGEYVSDSSHLLKGLVGLAEGFIVVIRAKKIFEEKSFQELSNLTNDNTRLAVRLLISLKSASDKDLHQDERTRRVLWALDNGYEHIEIDENNIIDGWQDREKEGLPRLMEALHSNMWSTMQKHNVPIPSVHTHGFGSSLSSSSSGTDSEMNSSNSVLIDSSLVPSSSTGIRNENLNGDLNGNIKNNLNNDKINDKHGLDMKGEDDREDKNIELFGQFSDILSKAKGYRTEAVDGKVSDEERKARAENVARALSSMLAINGDGDSDTDESI